MEVGYPGWTRRGIIGRNIKLLYTFGGVGGEEWCCGWSIFFFIILNTFNPFLDMSLEVVGKEAWRWVQFTLEFPKDTETTDRSWEDALIIAIVSFMPSGCPCVYWQKKRRKGPYHHWHLERVMEMEETVQRYRWVWLWVERKWLLISWCDDEGRVINVNKILCWFLNFISFK